MAAARANGVGVIIRAVQAGALTAAIDRPLPPDHPEMCDYQRATGFRRFAAELDMDPAVLAHGYALSLDIDTLVLGGNNRKKTGRFPCRRRSRAAGSCADGPGGSVGRVDKLK